MTTMPTSHNPILVVDCRSHGKVKVPRLHGINNTLLRHSDHLKFRQTGDHIGTDYVLAGTQGVGSIEETPTKY